tara:strand:+ start:432 stop:914 length:483 start_codon:yes stop_codon:yes gene_type:complete
MTRGNNDIIEMMSINEEIGSLNNKVKQLVQDLHGTQGVLGAIQDLTKRLNDKVGKLNKAAAGYRPQPTEENTMSIPASHTDGVNKRERVVPGPNGDSSDSLKVEEKVVVSSTDTNTTKPKRETKRIVRGTNKTNKTSVKEEPTKQPIKEKVKRSFKSFKR